ncbi:HEAT repeat domain-containing protein [Moorena sp. SIO3H5]|uniref:HEAT repeat domain-containing protein n=1 Tax=Moorena sp. SIO3H5 TaxID=2607834 RepID=UPI0013BC51FC|nr:HEAT repeat domain-containing protein [Moorena sp. SIO3H5]NEO68381.1 NACHT domain-containing protein [Moorena sp. SIO3H5]
MVTWDSYLASIRQEYAQWWQFYTLTDVEDRKRKHQQQTPGLFNFNLMVQTIKSEQPQTDHNQQETERLPVLEGLRKYAADHVLLVGRPGSGKSTALVRLLGDEGIQDKIPVLVELRYHQTSVLELVKDFLESNLGQPLDSKEIKTLLFQGEFLLLIDGVNELPSQEARLDLTKFRQKYQKTTPMIFTTRDLGVGGDLGIEKKLEMQPLSPEQIEEFVRKYLPDKGEQMLTQLGDRLREFGQTPLLLKMLCALFQNKGEIPSNLGLVFRSFTQFYSDNIKQDVKVSDESREFWPDLLQQLGFLMTTGDNPKEITVAISKTKAQEILADYLRQKDFLDPDVRARTWLKDLLNHHLLQQSGDLIEFRHQLIQEYYTAEYLLKQLPSLSDRELQQNYLNYLKWTETLVLMLQLVDHEAQAQRVVRLGLAVDWQLGAWLAGAVKPEFQEQTVGLVVGLDVPNLLKVQLLAITQLEKAIPELIKYLDNDNSDVRWVAAKALQVIGTKATIEPLIKCLDDNNYYVIILAVETLVKIGTKTTIKPLINFLDRLLDYDNLDVSINLAKSLGEIGKDIAIKPLSKFLDNDHYSLRSSAAEALGEIGTEGTIKPLIKLLDDENSYVRSSAAEALGKIGTEVALKPLIKCLDDENSYVRSSAAEALGKIGTEVAIEPLIKCLDDENSYVHNSTVEALGKIGTEATIYWLIKCLDDENSYVRSSAVESLGKIGTEVAIETLIKCLDDDHYSVRGSAAKSLRNIGTEETIILLIKCLDDDHYSVRSSAAEALGNIGTELAIYPLIKCLDDDHYSVRSSAAEALGKIGTELAIYPLIKCLDNPLIKCLDNHHYSMLINAVKYLAKIGIDFNNNRLMECLEYDHYFVRSSAAEALGNIGTEVAIEPLTKYLDDDHYWVRSSAAEALGNIGKEVAIEALIKCLDDHYYEVRRSAVEALEKIGKEVAIEALIKCLNDDDYDVCWMAAKALGNIGTEATIDPLIKYLDHKYHDLCWNAAEALGKVGRERTIHKLINLLNNEEFAGTYDIYIFHNTIDALNAIQERCQFYNPTYSPKPTPKADPPKLIATQTIYILHLSDLHITTGEQATLWSNQLAQDLTQDLQIRNLDALILSGDIANYSTPQEYQAAQQFLDNLCQDFPLDPKQIVLVPGNHDLNWKLAKRGYQLLDLEDYDGELKEGHYIKGEDVIRVRDEVKYQQRFAHFSDFYQAIKGQPYPLDYDQQAIIDHLPEQNLLILGLNSAWQLDHHFRDRASIHSGALSNALTEIRRNKDYGNCLKIAVWHHPLNSDGSDRITDQGFMQLLAVAGFRLFLHGHIHKAETSLFRYDLSPGGRKLDGICAGTFGAPTFELRSAYPWQYNLLKINGNQLTVRTRRREEENGAWKPDSRWGQGPGLGGLDHYSIEL